MPSHQTGPQRPRALALAAACAVALAGVALAQDKQAARKDDKKKAATTRTAVITPAVKPGPTPQQKTAADKGTHREAGSIKVQSADGQLKLQTLAVDGQGRVLALAAPPRYYSSTAKKATSEVHVFGADSKKVTSFDVPFHAQTINVGPDDTIYVAGDGRIARFDKAGKHLATHDLPHLKKLLADKDGLRKAAEKQIAQMKENFKRSVETFKKQKEKIEAIEADKRTALQKRQLEQYERILTSYKTTEKYYDNLKPDTIVQSNLQRLRIINGVAVSKKDLFVACGEGQGYGYAVWRMGHDFKNAKTVLTGLGGCCGQMDIQCDGDDLLVAENTKHRFARYDRDGKNKGAWGKRGTDVEDECFGGCCNPMNLRAGKDGIYTAESEGIIKRFNSKGEFVCVVGFAPLTGGCKNVAVGASPDGARVYFADQPGSRVIVLERKKPAAGSE